jgi:hypothetical protein
MGASPAYRHARAISPALARSLVAQFERPCARERAAVLERLVADRPLHPFDWPLLSMPALVIGARHDSVHPFSCAHTVAQRLPAAVLREVPPKDSGEAAHRAAVAEAIGGFLDAVPRRDSTLWQTPSRRPPPSRFDAAPDGLLDALPRHDSTLPQTGSLTPSPVTIRRCPRRAP